MSLLEERAVDGFADGRLAELSVIVILELLQDTENLGQACTAAKRSTTKEKVSVLPMKTD